MKQIFVKQIDIIGIIYYSLSSLKCLQRFLAVTNSPILFFLSQFSMNELNLQKAVSRLKCS